MILRDRLLTCSLEAIDMVDLKPCPFCGGYAMIDKELLSGHWVYQVRCTGCWATSPKINTKKEVVEAWNRRTDDG